MNNSTGEIKNSEELSRLFATGKSKKEDWFLIDNKPWVKCAACSGQGFIGHFLNSKVIPCVCIFDQDKTWAAAVAKQRSLPIASKDKGLEQMRNFPK